MPAPRDDPKRHCRDIIRQCLNIAEEKGDHFVAVHRDNDAECVVLITMLRAQPVMSVIVADKLAIATENEKSMYRLANDMNRESITGWHTLLVSGGSIIYMYRQCLWMSCELTREHLMDILCTCIAEYKSGKATLTAGDHAGASHLQKG